VLNPRAVDRTMWEMKMPERPVFTLANIGLCITRHRGVFCFLTPLNLFSRLYTPHLLVNC
jgi:hypothetical protein